MKHTCTVCGHVDEINPAKALGGMKKTQTPAAKAARAANLAKANEARKKKVSQNAQD